MCTSKRTLARGSNPRSTIAPPTSASRPKESCEKAVLSRHQITPTALFGSSFRWGATKSPLSAPSTVFEAQRAPWSGLDRSRRFSSSSERHRRSPGLSSMLTESHRFPTFPLSSKPQPCCPRLKSPMHRDGSGSSWFPRAGFRSPPRAGWVRSIESESQAAASRAAARSSI